MASMPELSGIAARLIQIAGQVAMEAEAATSMVRRLNDEANRIVTLASGLEHTAGLMEESVQQRANALVAARAALTSNRPVIDALENSVAGVASISSAIAEIAQESRILSLNARIEAARAGAGASAFAVVATGMSTLAARTKQATDQIGERAATIARDVSAATDIATAHAGLVSEQGALLESALESARHQRDTSARLAEITTQTAIAVDEAAVAIGRVSSIATAVKVMANQLSRLEARSG